MKHKIETSKIAAFINEKILPVFIVGMIITIPLMSKIIVNKVDLIFAVVMEIFLVWFLIYMKNIWSKVKHFNLQNDGLHISGNSTVVEWKNIKRIRFKAPIISLIEVVYFDNGNVTTITGYNSFVMNPFKLYKSINEIKTLYPKIKWGNQESNN